MLQRILDFFLPPECVVCRSATTKAHTLCVSCFSKFSFIQHPVCEDCGYPLPDVETKRCAHCMISPPPYDKGRSVLVYDEASKSMILKLKHCDNIDLAVPLARLVYHQHKDILRNVDFVIPVPLHRWRLWKRRYNQSTLVARELLKLMKGDENIPRLLCDSLVRVKSTPSQGSSHAQRHKNMQGAFGVKDASKKLVGKSIILLDDVLTSGATIKACARSLKRHGVSHVTVLTLARVIKGEMA